LVSSTVLRASHVCMNSICYGTDVDVLREHNLLMTYFI